MTSHRSAALAACCLLAYISTTAAFSAQPFFLPCSSARAGSAHGAALASRVAAPRGAARALSRPHLVQLRAQSERSKGMLSVPAFFADAAAAVHGAAGAAIPSAAAMAVPDPARRAQRPAHRTSCWDHCSLPRPTHLLLLPARHHGVRRPHRRRWWWVAQPWGPSQASRTRRGWRRRWGARRAHKGCLSTFRRR